MDRMFFIVLLGFGLLINICAANAVTFSGTISLPSGTTAGAGGAEFEVSTQLLEVFVDGNNQLQLSSDTATIPPFGNSATFSFELPPTPNYSEHNITFDCEVGCDSIDATTTGFWSETDGVLPNFFDATDYSSTQNQIINIQLEDADSFSGVIRLPDGFDATGDEQIVIRLREDALFSFGSYPSYIYPELGETSFNFSIGVPTAATASGWKLEYYCNSCDTNIEPADHFPTTATGDPASLNEDDQHVFIKGNDYQAMTMTFLPVNTNSAANRIIGPIHFLLDD